MRSLAVFVLIVTAALSQVTVAPLFPMSAAIPDLGLVTLLLLAVFAGPKTVMVAMPMYAIFLGFASERSPGLLVLAYLPLLPLAYLLEEASLPLSRLFRLLVVGGATGVWIRGIMAMSSVAQGAEFAVGDLIGSLLVPGLFLDLALLTIAYLPFRLIGLTSRGMTLQRGGY